ncbi:MAG: tetratricopeptide repeat protein, partial [Tepidisphaeraceae bacterium]
IHNNLGTALKDKGQLDEAIAAYRQAIALNPNLPDVHYNLGIALYDKGEMDDAITAYRRALALNPNFAEVHSNNLGNALKHKGRLDEAITAYRRAIDLNPKYAEAHSNLGNALTEKGQLDEAVAACRRAIALRNNYAEAYYNLGIALKAQAKFDEAIAAYRQAIALRPNYADACNNLGIALRDKGELNESISAYRQAITFKPNLPEAHHNLSLALLARGDFQPGWEEYEWRWKCNDFSSPPRNFTQPQWDGRPLEDRTILLHAEQGYGDAIHFIRYVPLVIRRGGKIVVECQAELQRLFQTVATGCQIVVRGQPLPAFDFHCPLLSLPRVFGTNLGNIPNDVPYLSADPELVETWSRMLGSANGQLRVGLAWAGHPRFKDDRTRSLNLQQLAPFAAVQGVKIYSLQKGPAGEQARNPPAGLQLIDLGPDLNDFADTAAVMSLMDLIVTTDTSVPHLAGALARPVWVMLQYVPDFRWLLERQDSPWYPSMRLFRQPRAKDWDSVITRVADELSSWIKNRA